MPATGFADFLSPFLIRKAGFGKPRIDLSEYVITGTHMHFVNIRFAGGGVSNRSKTQRQIFPDTVRESGPDPRAGLCPQAG